MKTKIILSIILSVFVMSIYSQTENTLTDKRDGKIYKTIKVGLQTWMAENLNYNAGNGSWCYNDSNVYCDKYGRLYSWETAKQVCPEGWHLPDNNEWATFIESFGGEEFAGAKLKSTTGWKKPEPGSGKKCGHNSSNTNKEGLLIIHDTVATNSSNFTGLPGGGHYLNNIYDYAGEYGLWWSASQYNANQAWYYNMYYSNIEGIYKYYAIKLNAFSVRCILN